MSNQPVAQKAAFSVAITTAGFQRLISSTLQDPHRIQRFTSSIVSAVSVNPALQECDVKSVLSCALLGESLGLSPSPQLGQYYMVPFEQKAKYDKEGNMISPAVKHATFIIGYKGYIQLAIRSGQYKTLNVMVIKKGELVRYDPLTEDITVNLITDELKRETTETSGYYAVFEYTNGFRKAMYWSREKMEQHADRYSKAFNLGAYSKLLAGQIADKDMWKYSSFWYKDFDGMAIKTMLRQLISKWGIMSVEMEKAVVSDGSAVGYDEKANVFTHDFTTGNHDTEFTEPLKRNGLPDTGTTKNEQAPSNDDVPEFLQSAPDDGNISMDDL